MSDYVFEWVDGVAISCLTTGQVWDASCWTRQDWEEFCSPDFDKLCVLEMMDEYASFEALRDRKVTA